MIQRTRQAGFTLLEVLIAMSILAVGATSILGIFVAAVRFHTDRVEDNRITELLNHAMNHAEIAFNTFDPQADKDNTSALPKPIHADLTDTLAALQSPDPMIREAAEKFKGFKYDITFEDNDWTVPGASVVATIKIYRLSGKKDESTPFDKVILMRSGTPVQEFFKSPSMEERDRKGMDSERREANR